MSHKQIFSEAQILEIVQRAVQLQEEAQNEGVTYTPGVTREELERIASEVGVKGEFLERAIRELTTPQQRRALTKNPLFRHAFEHVVDAELPMDKFDLVAEELPLRNSQSPPTQIGRSLRAKGMTGTNMTDVSITARNGRTRVKVETFPLLSWIFGGHIAFISTIMGSAMIAEHGMIGGGIALIGVGLSAGIGFLLGTSRNGAHKAEQLAGNIAKLVEQETSDLNIQATSTQPPEEVAKSVQIGRSTSEPH